MMSNAFGENKRIFSVLILESMMDRIKSDSKDTLGFCSKEIGIRSDIINFCLDVLLKNPE